MKNKINYLRNCIAILFVVFSLNTHAQSYGLVPELSIIKDKVEADFLYASKADISPDALKEKYNKYCEVRTAMNALISRLVSDLKLYDGILGNRTLRNIKKVDKLIIKSGLKNLTDSGNTKLMRSYFLLCKNVQSKYTDYNSFRIKPNYGNISNGGSDNKKDSTSFIGPIKEGLDYAIAQVEKIREANKKKSDELIAVLEKLRLEMPTITNSKESKK